MESFPHKPVLLEEVKTLFSKGEMRTFFDGTLGAAGHAEAILKSHPEIERYIGCDMDPVALHIAKKRLSPFGNRVEFIQGNFSDIDRYLDERNISCIDGCFFDVGVSSMQMDDQERGISFRFDAPLDMRMDPTLTLTAKEIINSFSEKDLADIFYTYGEEKKSRQVAKKIVEARIKKSIDSTFDLLEVISPVLNWKKKGFHPATLVFQALRIYVNKELEMLEKGLDAAIHRLCPHGMIGVISFHRLEDRIVKTLFKNYTQKKKQKYPFQKETSSLKKEAIEVAPQLEIVTKKPIVPSNDEVKKNVRARSAKLRFAIRGGL